MTRKTSRSGFSLIESAIILGIIAVVIGGIWIAATTVRENQGIRRMQEQVLQISQNVKRVFRGMPLIGVTDLTSLTLRDNIFPEDMLDGPNPVTPWGGLVRAEIGVNSAQLTIEIEGLTQSQCTRLGPLLFNVLRKSGRVKIATLNEDEDVMTLADAGANCAAEATGNGGEASIYIVIYTPI